MGLCFREKLVKEMFPSTDLTKVVKRIKKEIIFCRELQCTTLTHFKTPVLR